MVTSLSQLYIVDKMADVTIYAEDDLDLVFWRGCFESTFAKSQNVQ